MNATTIEQATDSSIGLFAPSVPTYGYAIDQGLQQLSSQAGVSTNDIDLCQTLRSELLDLIHAKLIQLEQPQILEQLSRWGWQSWMDTQALRIGFLTVDANKPIPIHDHPGSAGLLIVLQGKLQVQQFTASTEHTSARRIELSLEQELDAGPGEFVTFSPFAGNIHSVRAHEETCIVLDVLLTPYKEQERGWYMPIGENRRGQTQFNTIRVSRTK